MWFDLQIIQQLDQILQDIISLVAYQVVQWFDFSSLLQNLWPWILVLHSVSSFTYFTTASATCPKLTFLILVFDQCKLELDLDFCFISCQQYVLQFLWLKFYFQTYLIALIEGCIVVSGLLSSANCVHYPFFSFHFPFIL